MSTTIDKLKRRRAVIKTQQTHFKKFLYESFPDSEDAFQLRERLTKMEEIWKEFDNVQSELEYLDSEGNQEEKRVEIENTFFELSAKSKQLLQRFEAQPRSENSESRTATTNQGINPKLPKINLPQFDGSYESWMTFEDTFHSLIHENDGLLPVQKLQYLRSCLRGEALAAIQSFETTADNYLEAWTLLRDLYRNPRLITFKNIALIFDIPPMSKESPALLRKVINTVQQNLRALSAIGEPVDQWDSLIIFLLVSKLDKSTRRKWEHSLQDAEMPSLKSVITFLNRIGQTTEITVSRPNTTNPLRRTNQQTFFATKIECPICRHNHVIQKCPTWLEMTASNRLEAVKNARLCTNCLKGSHPSSKCLSGNCRKCSKRHNTLLHIDKEQTISQSTNSIMHESQPSTSQTNSFTTLYAAVNREVLLSTALVSITDKNGVRKKCRALLDSGSQSNFITDELTEALNLIRLPINTSICGLANNLTTITHYVTTNINSLVNSHSLKLTFLTIPKISNNLPSRNLSRRKFDIPRNIRLADPEFFKSAKIDLLIGAGSFFSLLCVGQIELPFPNDPVTSPRPILQKSKFGWLIAGEVSHERSNCSKQCHITTKTQDLLSSEISRFWEIEELSDAATLLPEQSLCEIHYQNHIQRLPSGQYMVRFPFNNLVKQLGTSRNTALKRFLSLERKFDSNPAICDQYHKFMEEYISLGHMTEITENSENTGYYLPHHPVLKESSLSILSILSILRFRTHALVFTADIEKMYRQTSIHPDDRMYQKILWRNHKGESIRTYQLNTNTYGLTCAPFLSIRSLHQLAQDESYRFPIASKIALTDFYVDDLISGSNSLIEAIEARDELIKLFQSGGMRLRQWRSNDKRLLTKLDKHNVNEKMLLDDNAAIKTLGIYWHANNDTLHFTVDPTQFNYNQITKRSMLSEIAKLFDPLGLLGPIIVKAKILMQTLWQAKINWDESIPTAIHTSWNRYRLSLPEVDSLILNRRILTQDCVKMELHGFCDASQSAYGACIYIRFTATNGSHASRLICSKFRVAPIKPCTIPRLELCAALLLAKLMKTVINSLKLSSENVTMWSDSMIVLHWIKTPSKHLKTFVANRILEIQSLTTNYNWRHICSSDNPADILSRGQFADEFIKNQPIWFNGPIWLTDDKNVWPESKLVYINELPELKPKISLIAVPNVQHFDLLNKFSSISKLKCVVAYCLRFRYHTDSRLLTLEELSRAMLTILKLVQFQEFREDITCLKQNKQLKSKRLQCLNPFLDENELLRVGGRITNANIPFAEKHPILLPQGHHVTNLVIRFEHIKNYHAGTQATLYALRKTYWVTNGRNTIRKIIRQCVTCTRLRAGSFNYPMAPLPLDRVNITRPFQVVGVDYCGPFFIKERKFRNRSKLKVYVAVFVCFLIKAVHLEVVSELTTEAFLAALKRFIARRGLCKRIYSDHGTNFVGANNHFTELNQLLKSPQHQDALHIFASNEGFTRQFIPPHAPHFGGLWESAVKGFKHHLKRTIGETLLTYKNLNTVVVEIEAILNSRPLSPISSDPNDLSFLTPGHFLIGECLTSIPEINYLDVPTNRLSAWKHIQKIKQDFWKRWYKEYLNEITTRHKWHTSDVKVQCGTMVLVKEPNLPPLKWVIGRVIDVHPGPDGVIRVVSVKTANGTIKRCVKTLAPLNEESN